LESLIVFGVGLDKSISKDDNPYDQHHETKSLIYQAMTRAHLRFSFINEKVEGGWLEWLRLVKTNRNIIEKTSIREKDISQSKNDDEQKTGNSDNNKEDVRPHQGDVPLKFVEERSKAVANIGRDTFKSSSDTPATSFDSSVFGATEGARLLSGVRFNPAGRGGINDGLKGDKDCVLTAVKQNGTALEYASDTLKGDKDIVSSAVKEDGNALQYASDTLKKDKDFVLTAVKQRGNALESSERNASLAPMSPIHHRAPAPIGHERALKFHNNEEIEGDLLNTLGGQMAGSILDF
jgi:hypothetical protein